MYRILPYLGLFAAVVLLQVFLFDNLSISIYLCPLVYVAFVILLPLDTPHVALLGAALALGVVMDNATGAAGLNTISTLPVAFLRPWIIALLYGRDDVREGGIPSSVRLGSRVYIEYLVVMVLLHQVLFFAFEALSWAHVWHTLLRVVVSSVVTMAFVWLIGKIFTAKFAVRV